MDRTLFFGTHASNLCKEAGRKLSVLARLSSYMTLKNCEILHGSPVWLLATRLDVLW